MDKAASSPVYLYYRAMNNWLDDNYGGESENTKGGNVVSPWAFTGVKPAYGAGLAARLVTSANYFTSYSWEGTVHAIGLRADSADQARAAYVEAFGNAIPKVPNSSYGLEAIRPAEVRAAFFSEYAFPPCLDGMAKGKREDVSKVLERARGREVADAGPEPLAFVGITAKRMLDELHLYRALLTGDLKGLEERFGEVPEAISAWFGTCGDEARILHFYRSLLPIWVFTQRLSLNLGDLGAQSYDECDTAMPLNIYNIDFWASFGGGFEANNKDEGPRCASELVDALCDYYSTDPTTNTRLVDELSGRCVRQIGAVARTLRLEHGFKLKLAKHPKEARALKGMTVWELLKRCEMCAMAWEKDLAWVRTRADLIETVTLASYVGLDAALGREPKPRLLLPASAPAPTPTPTPNAGSGLFTLERWDEQDKETRAYGRGVLAKSLGSVALTLYDDVTSNYTRACEASLRIDGDFGLVRLVGAGYDARQLEECRQTAEEVITEFFAVPGIGQDVSPFVEAVLAMAKEKAREYDIATASGRGKLEGFRELERHDPPVDTAQLLSTILCEELLATLRRSLAAAGGRAIIKGSDDKAGAETLVGAANNAAVRFNKALLEAWEELPGSRDGKSRPGITVRLKADLKGLARGTYERYVQSRDGNEPLLLALIREACDEVAGHGGDPTARIALRCLYRRLGEHFAGSCAKQVSLGDISNLVERAFNEACRLEEERYSRVDAPSYDVSRRHAVLFLDLARDDDVALGSSAELGESLLFVADAGSKNGTLVERRGEDRVQRYFLTGSRDDARNFERFSASVRGGRGQVTSVSRLALKSGDVVRLAGRSAMRVG